MKIRPRNEPKRRELSRVSARNSTGVLVPKNFDKNVRAARAHVTRRKVHLFERRARAYRTCLANPGNDTFVKLENAVKERKVHRNAADFDGKFIRDTMEEDEIPTEGV